MGHTEDTQRREKGRKKRKVSGVRSDIWEFFLLIVIPIDSFKQTYQRFDETGVEKKQMVCS